MRHEKTLVILFAGLFAVFSNSCHTLEDDTYLSGSFEAYNDTYNEKYEDFGENVSLESEVSTCPWNEGHHLIRVGMKGFTIPENEFP